MSKLQQFIEELTDFELINFYNFRYEQFLHGSKDKINSEFEKRNLDKTQSFQSNYPVSGMDKACPRCNSTKFYNSTEIETITYSYASIDIERDYRTCLVCLFSEGKDSINSGNRNVSAFGFLRTLINRRK